MLIIGYDFQCDTYCVGDCITQAVDGRDPQSGMLAHVERCLDEIAAERGIDRTRERSFDQTEFPKVIRSTTEFVICPRCIRCGGVLDGHDPRAYDETEEI